MRNPITQSNEWYDNLPEPKRILFFLIVIWGSLVVVQYLSIVEGFIWGFQYGVQFLLYGELVIFSHKKINK